MIKIQYRLTKNFIVYRVYTCLYFLFNICLLQNILSNKVRNQKHYIIWLTTLSLFYT